MHVCVTPPTGPPQVKRLRRPRRFRHNRRSVAQRGGGAAALTCDLSCDLSPLQIGDRIVSICRTPTDGMTHAQAVALLKNATGTVQLQVGGAHARSQRRMSDIP